MKPTIKVQSNTIILGGKFSWPPVHVNDKGRGNLNESKLTWKRQQTSLCVLSYFNVNDKGKGKLNESKLIWRFPRVFFQLIKVWRSFVFFLVSWVYFKIERSQAQVNFHSCQKLLFNVETPILPVSYVSTSQSTMKDGLNEIPVR